VGFAVSTTFADVPLLPPHLRACLCRQPSATAVLERHHRRGCLATC
jgi:hypothetical protein